MIRTRQAFQGPLTINIGILASFHSFTERLDDSFAYIVFGGVGLFWGIRLLLQGIKWSKRKKLIDSVPTSKISSLAKGLVEIFGEVVPAKDEIHKTPFTNKDCVYYKYTIEELRGSGKSISWVTIKTESKGSYFYLKDDSGSVLVDPEGSEIDILSDREFESGFRSDPPESIKQFLKGHGLNFEGFLGINKTMRYSEYYITPGDKLFILGVAGDSPLAVEEWKQTGIRKAVIKRGENKEPFYISDKSEREVLSRARRKIVLGVLGGALTAGAVFLILWSLSLI